jgi:lantibiotic leader peptide-processing serine protease
MTRVHFAAAAAALVAILIPAAVARGGVGLSQNYLVVLTDSQPNTAGYQLSETDRQAALTQIASAGGTIVEDISRDIGVLVAASPSATFASSLSSSSVVASVGQDAAFQGIPSGATSIETVTSAPAPDNDSPEAHADPLEALQWNMALIRAPQANAQRQAGKRAVEVGVLDSGIDGNHVDFKDPLGDGTNVDCSKGHDSLAVLPPGVAVGNPDPCTDNQFHGTHVAGIIAAQANGVGVVGVAPNVSLIPVKVCDSTGFCYVSAVVDGIYYAGKMRFEVINMSFFVDDNSFQDSTRLKCMNDPVQRTFRLAVERAIDYARMRGVTPVAALGNEEEDLAHPAEPYENDCEEIPAEVQGVIGVSALTASSELASYSNYGDFAVDVAAPGGSASRCGTIVQPAGVVSTIPGAWGCFAGTSMASPHATGVAALIESQFGYLDNTGDWEMRPNQVEQYLQGTTIDIGLRGYDECYGNGRIDALKAVFHDTGIVYEAHNCIHYATQP